MSLLGLLTATTIPREMQANTSAAKTPFKMAKGTNDGFRSSPRFPEAEFCRLAIIFTMLVNLMALIFVDTIILRSCSLEIELQNDCRRFPEFLDLVGILGGKFVKFIRATEFSDLKKGAIMNSILTQPLFLSSVLLRFDVKK